MTQFHCPAVFRRRIRIHATTGFPQSRSPLPVSHSSPSAANHVPAVVLRHRAGNRLRDAANSPRDRLSARSRSQRPGDAVPDGRLQRRNAAGRRADSARQRRRGVELYSPSTGQPIPFSQVGHHHCHLSIMGGLAL